MARKSRAEQLADLLAREVPQLAEVVEVRESMYGEGLGLYSKKKFEDGETICEFSKLTRAVMEPREAIAAQLESGDFGALAFEVLKQYRKDEPSPWKDWIESGTTACDTHPLKLLLTNPERAKRLWSSTTCGGRMAGMALQVNSDIEALQGGATLEEWADFLALVMSRSVVRDRADRPLLVLGLDLLQASDLPTVEIECVYEQAGAGPFGLGGTGPELFAAVRLKAFDTIEVGQELSMRYLASPHAGGYLEQYGFVPDWLRGELADAAVELSFSPIDPEDYFVDVKESVCEDLGLPTAPMRFMFSSNEGITSPRQLPDWDMKNDLDKMTHILRFRTCGGNDSFLLDAVYYDKFWDHCNYRISKENEKLVYGMAIEEVDRWLARFDALEEAGPDPDDELSQLAAEIRRRERSLLEQVRLVFFQETELVMLDNTLKYWVDRQMDVVFPERTPQAVRGY